MGKASISKEALPGVGGIWKGGVLEGARGELRRKQTEVSGRAGRRAGLKRQTLLSVKTGLHLFPKLGIALKVTAAQLRAALSKLNAFPYPIGPEYGEMSGACSDPTDSSTAVGFVIRARMDMSGLYIDVMDAPHFDDGGVIPEISLSRDMVELEETYIDFDGRECAVYMVPVIDIIGFSVAGNDVDGIAEVSTEKYDAPVDPKPMDEDDLPDNTMNIINKRRSKKRYKSK